MPIASQTMATSIPRTSMSLFSNTTISNSSASSDNITELYIKQAFSGRFYAYTLLLTGCLLLNTLSLLAMSRMRARGSVHHRLLFNLAVTDIIGSLLLWMYYNSPYIFPRFPIVTLPQCLFIIVVLLALSTSALALLALALNQYIAICHPCLRHT